jgi:putative transposase
VRRALTTLFRGAVSKDIVSRVWRNLLAVKSMGGESAEAWRTVLDDLIKRGLRRQHFLIVDGAAGLEKAIAAVWDGVPVQTCTVHKHRNLLAHAPERLHDEGTADYTDMIYAATPNEIEAGARPSSASGG